MFMSRLKNRGVDKDRYCVFRTAIEDKCNANYTSLLSILPQIDTAISMCTTRLIVLELHNHEVLRNFVT